ncbi:MAG: hypothetical protein ACE5JU_23390, partial [Candidatus Binatia bacterium]
MDCQPIQGALPRKAGKSQTFTEAGGFQIGGVSGRLGAEQTDLTRARGQVAVILFHFTHSPQTICWRRGLWR